MKGIVKSSNKTNLQAEMMVTVENAVELQELFQIASEQMKQLEITLSKINGFQTKASVLKT